MGLAFDSNGIYVGWSNLFKYSSLKALLYSEYLPSPLKNTYVETTNNTVDAIEVSTKLLDKIIEIGAIQDLNERDILEVKLYTRLLKSIYSKTEGNLKVYIRFPLLTINDPIRAALYVLAKLSIIYNLNSHEHTTIPIKLLANAEKNFISSHIQNTVLHPINMLAAYSPIQMENFRSASKLSSKGNEAESFTMLNPAMKLLMLVANMTGKNVIGISANGMKASFMWHYYLNDLISAGVNLDKGQFSFNLVRVIGRSKGQIVPKTITGLPEININKIRPDIAKLFGIIIEDGKVVRYEGVVKSDITVDLMISQVLSAATDSRF